MPATGGVIPSQQINTVKLLKYNNPEDYVLMATEFIFIIYILYYVVEESIEIRMHGFSYFTNICISDWINQSMIVYYMSTVNGPQ